MKDAKELANELCLTRKSAWESITDEQKQEVFEYAKGYIEFINCAKTERQIIKSAKKMAEEKGYRDIATYEKLHEGDKVYYINRDKSMYLAIIGKQDIKEGLNIIGSHGDSPRLDLKMHPLYEKADMAYFDTHYYGGIKKYQWTTIPYSLHGVVINQKGEKIEISIGEKEDEPIFTITELLIHLASKQMEKNAKEVVEGENLDLLAGNIPYNGEMSDRVKLNILNILNQKYGIKETDFASAELEAVPALQARTLGLDESMVAAYGQDDKVCVYTSLTAMMELESVDKTAVCIISDKEEIGSMGNTGMQSQIFDLFIAEMLNKMDNNEANALEKVLCRSRMLSADVDAGYDPLYAAAYEERNSNYIGYGPSINKYTGARGKSGASDANAEYLASIKQLFEKENICYQFGEMGRIDVGGGGTIAYMLANRGADVIDCGIPILSMHSPYEVASKVDIYEVYRAYKAFWNN